MRITGLPVFASVIRGLAFFGNSDGKGGVDEQMDDFWDTRWQFDGREPPRGRGGIRGADCHHGES